MPQVIGPSFRTDSIKEPIVFTDTKKQNEYERILRELSKHGILNDTDRDWVYSLASSRVSLGLVKEEQRWSGQK
jgi:hypothetical protein